MAKSDGIKFGAIQGIDKLLLAWDDSSSSSSSNTNSSYTINYTIEYYVDGELYDSEEYQKNENENKFYFNWNEIDKLKYYPDFLYVNNGNSMEKLGGCSISDGDVIKLYYESNSASDVKTNIKSKTDIITSTNSGNVNNNLFNEPALLGIDNMKDEWMTFNGKRVYELAGFSSYEEMGEAFVTDYKNMSESIEKYGGFYVGRYELCGDINSIIVGPITNPSVSANAYPAAGGTWYRMYAGCRVFSTDVTVSTMIWGCQWDELCLWTANFGDKISYNTVSQISHREDDSGTDPLDVRNNIYDLQGSRNEWTQEAYGNENRVIRSSRGYYNNPMSNKELGDPMWYGTGNSTGTRPTLYIK